VRRAIDRYRRALDADPVVYLHGSSAAREAAVLRAAATFTGARAADIALTDSTTMGLALLYNGIHVRAGQELLTSTHDFFVTHDALQLRADRTARRCARSASTTTARPPRPTRSSGAW
jgi:selenocysteine lyase/cysteine desulfurase